MFDYSSKTKYYDDSSKLVVGKIKDETGGIATKEIVGLKPKMNSFLVNDGSKPKKANCVNKNAVETISHSEYKDVFLNKKCLRHSMNKIQSKDHRIGTYETYETNKISLSCFDDKTHILNNEYDR